LAHFINKKLTLSYPDKSELRWSDSLLSSVLGLGSRFPGSIRIPMLNKKGLPKTERLLMCNDVSWENLSQRLSRPNSANALVRIQKKRRRCSKLITMKLPHMSLHPKYRYDEA